MQGHGDHVRGSWCNAEPFLGHSLLWRYVRYDLDAVYNNHAIAAVRRDVFVVDGRGGTRQLCACRIVTKTHSCKMYLSVPVPLLAYAVSPLW